MSTNKTTNLNMHSWVGTDPFKRTEFNDNFKAIDDYVGDLVKNPVYGITTGTAPDYVVNFTPAVTTLKDGAGIVIKIHADYVSGVPTINVNTLGKKGLKKGNGSDFTNLKAGGVYTFRYNASNANFILQGEGGSGTAIASDILSGKTASSDAGDLTGTMPNRGGAIFTPSTTNQTIAQGYHDGNGYVKGDVNLISANILSGKTIFGVAGKSSVVDTASATAVAGDMLSGKTAYVNGALVTGNIPSKTAQSYTPTTADQTISSGQYLSGVQTVKGDANLIPANIKAGTSIFGVAGATNVIDTTQDTMAVTPSNMRTGMVAYVNGAKVTGTMAYNSALNISPTKDTQSFPAGFYAGVFVSGDDNLVSANIKSGVTIFGVAGSSNVIDTAESTVPILAPYVLSGKVGFVNGAKVIGTMSDKGALTVTPTRGSQGLAGGYYSSITVYGDDNLLSANIKSGVTIFGVAGSSKVVDTTLGGIYGAVAGDILTGKSAFVDGVKIDGTMTNRGAYNITPSGSAQTIPQGYHSGSGTVSAVVVPVANVLSGTTIAGQAGTMVNKGNTSFTPTTSDVAIPQGYYNGSGVVKGDANLLPANIIKGKTIFGVSGTAEFATAQNLTDFISASNSLLGA